MLYFDLYFQLIQQWTIASLVSAASFITWQSVGRIYFIATKRNLYSTGSYPRRSSSTDERGVASAGERGRVLFLGRTIAYEIIGSTPSIVRLIIKERLWFLAGGTQYTHTHTADTAGNFLPFYRHTPTAL
jgi:hypothetical protein